MLSVHVVLRRGKQTFRLSRSHSRRRIGLAGSPVQSQGRNSPAQSGESAREIRLQVSAVGMFRSSFELARVLQSGFIRERSFFKNCAYGTLFNSTVQKITEYERFNF